MKMVKISGQLLIMWILVAGADAVAKNCWCGCGANLILVSGAVFSWFGCGLGVRLKVQC